MTEIPEPLLRRSRQRRPATGAGEDDAAATTPTTAIPGGATAPAPPFGDVPQPVATEPAPPPRPPSLCVVAARSRRRVPLWAMPVLVCLPVWAFIYMEALTPIKAAPNTPLGVGAQVFARCAACHGGAGEGGAGYKLNQGEVLKTFPKIEDQILFVANGSPTASVPYGDPHRSGGQRISGALGGLKMPAWKNEGLSTAQIIGAVCHERFDAAGAKPDDPQWQQQYNNWCAPGAPNYIAAQLGGPRILSDLAAAAATP